MRRPFVNSIFALALGLAPAALFAQAPAPTQPPAGQPPPAQTPAQPAPTQPKLGLTSPAGALLVPIKPDQTAVFEEFVTKLKAGLAKSSDPTLKQQASGFKIYKAAEPFGTNALYVVTIEPVVPNADYELFDMLRRTMTPEELRAPEAAAMWKRYADAFASGPSRLSLTPVGGQ
jgi:S1-C subfamily serine protease